MYSATSPQGQDVIQGQRGCCYCRDPDEKSFVFFLDTCCLFSNLQHSRNRKCLITSCFFVPFSRLLRVTWSFHLTVKTGAIMTWPWYRFHLSCVKGLQITKTFHLDSSKIHYSQQEKMLIRFFLLKQSASNIYIYIYVYVCVCVCVYVCVCVCVCVCVSQKIVYIVVSRL